MKRFTLMMVAVMSLAFVQLALAVPTLCNIQVGATCLADTGDETFTINDTDGTLDTITSFVVDRNAGFANDFGFYDLNDSTNRLGIFSGVDPVLSAATIEWDGSGYAVLGGGPMAVFGSGAEFGIYSENSGGNTWFSETALNADGVDHWLVFNTLATTSGFLGAMNLTFALDDQYGGGDQDFNDLVLGCIDCVSADLDRFNVPEPTPLALMGFGLLFMRKRMNGSLL